ncbi:MAG TPA: thiosulfate oxidation carrier protein SoxY [Aquabacterium sp.]|nr:thiosulfate oxidation carrier protein SoxY [Aquabacterium sp.]HQC94085.1 thiosulfate oxidation carrier protein SoxY [Aquabacterium sp.]
MRTRRALLAHSTRLAALLAAAGLLPPAAQAAWNAAAFEARTLPELARLLGTAAPAESREVSLGAPEVAENGAAVPVVLGSTLPGLRRLLLLVEKNTTPLAAIFEVGEAVEPQLTTRVKMGQSSDVYAVAVTADNRLLFTRREVKVTLGGCGG